MSKATDELGRLKALLDNRAIDQAEFDREVARLDEDNDGSAMSVGARVMTFILGAALLATLVYFNAPRKSSDRNAAAPQTVAANAAETDSMSASTESFQEPPADYKALCVYSGLTALGTRQSTMADILSKQGRSLVWEAAGDNWILRTRWHDQLTGLDREESFEFQRREGAEPAAACNRPIGEVHLSRVAQDGVEVTEPDPTFALLFHKDLGPTNAGGEPTATGNGGAAINDAPMEDVE